jgi:hypothetical protein
MRSGSNFSNNYDWGGGLSSLPPPPPRPVIYAIASAAITRFAGRVVVDICGFV